ncbi:MAG: bifunctional folylpolyglutamate synthase/dihydrofolate synthase [Eubacterium sp.]
MYNNAVEYILSIPKFTKKNPLDNTRALIKTLGNPGESMKIVHVAGTNGKGSVCAYLSQILIETGHKTGMFTSPHLVKMNERIKINGCDISDEEFIKCFDKVYEATNKIIADGYEHPTFFEFIFAMAMVAFENSDVEYVVLETGMGGRLDATNVFTQPVLSIITQVDMDHMEYLGYTIEDIAYEKAGIIKDNIPVLFLNESEKVSEVIISVAKSKNASICQLFRADVKIIKNENKMIDFCIANSYYGSNVFSLNSIACYQAVNASMAIMAAYILDICDISAIKRAIYNTKWEGRMEEILPGVFVDGAHNPAAVIELSRTIITMGIKNNLYILFAVVKDKDYESMLCLLEKIPCDGVILTKVDGSRGLETDILRHKCKQFGTKVYSYDTLNEAFEAGLRFKSNDGVLVCFGSLYLVGGIKDMLRRNKDD